MTDAFAIVETEPYPNLTGLGSRLRIAQFLTLLPSGSAINRDPLIFFRIQGGS